MAGSTPNVKLRRRMEIAIRVFSPALDVMLAAADRVSRLRHRGHPDEPPVRMRHEGESAPRGLRSRIAPGD